MMMCTFIFYFLINSAAFSQTSQCQSNLIMTTTTDFMPPLTAIPFGTPFTITTVVRNTGRTPQNVSLQLRLSPGTNQPLFEVLCADDYSWNGNTGQRSFQVLGIIYENFGRNDLAQINSLHIDNTADDVGVGIRVVNNNFCQSYIGQNNIKAKIGILSAWNRFNAANVGQISFNLIESSNPADPVNSVGILGYENSTTGNWNISNNNINVQSAAFGMLSYSGNGAFITNNTISMQPYSHVNATGIYTSGGSNLNASCNNILGAGLGGGAYRSSLVISGGTGSSYTCNNTNASEVGFNVVGEMRPFLMSGNRFNNHSVGLVVNDETYIGLQFLRGNKWQGLFTRGIGAELVNPTTFRISQNRFRIGINAPPIEPATNAPGWFQLVNGADLTCTSLNACPNGNPAGRLAGGNDINNDAFYSSAMSTERIQSPHAEEMKWTAQRNAYGRLMDNPSEQNSREITAFMGNMRNTSTGQLYQVEKGMKDAQNIGQEFNDVLLTNANTIKTLANEIADLDAKIFTATGAAKTALMTQKKEKNATIHRLSTENAPRHATIERKRNQELQRLMRENERVSTRLQPEINEKEVNRIYMETVAEGKMVLNREQTVTARAIAFQCPSKGGNAVFAARSLYSLVENVKFDDLALCNLRSEPIQGLVAKKVIEDFKISPNPATDMLNVTQSTEKAETGEWLIFNTAGKLLLSKKVGENEMQANINIQSLSEGIYIVSFVVNGEKRFNQKFIKIKSN
jgi:Secretion system C-terminal sorting domain